MTKRDTTAMSLIPLSKDNTLNFGFDSDSQSQSQSQSEGDYESSYEDDDSSLMGNFTLLSVQAQSQQPKVQQQIQPSAPIPVREEGESPELYKIRCELFVRISSSDYSGYAESYSAAISKKVILGVRYSDDVENAIRQVCQAVSFPLTVPAIQQAQTQ